MDTQMSFKDWKLANPNSKLCAVLYCKEKMNSKMPLSLFKYPMKDPERCREWCVNTGRMDLLHKPNEIQHYQVCINHFNKRMYYKEAGSDKLYKWATPVLQDETSSQTIVVKDIKTISEPRTDYIKFASVPLLCKKAQIQPSCSTGTCKCTCRNDKKINSTLVKMRTTIKMLRCKERQLRKKKKSVENPGPVIFSPSEFKLDFIDKTMKMFPKDTANFIKQQIEHIGRSETGTRYTDEYKDFCVQLSKQSGDAYKFLQTTFALPHVSHVVHRRKKLNTLKAKNGETEINVNEGRSKK